jgi:hypothetical protein
MDFPLGIKRGEIREKVIVTGSFDTVRIKGTLVCQRYIIIFGIYFTVKKPAHGGEIAGFGTIIRRALRLVPSAIGGRHIDPGGIVAP